MVNKGYILIIFLAVLSSMSFAQQQDPTEIQNQMNLADQARSAANTTTYKTPFKTYQQWYSRWTANDVKATLDCYTDSARQKELSGAKPSDQEFANMSKMLQEVKYLNYQLLSFKYTTDVQHPKITALISYQKGTLQMTEQFIFTLVDTSTGWKCDDIAETQISQTVIHKEKEVRN